MDAHELKALLQDVISDRLPGASITDVEVERDVDTDGDEVLEITVIFEASSDLDAERVAGLVRHLRPRLREHGENGFPVMSFISQKEARRRRVAAE